MTNQDYQQLQADLQFAADAVLFAEEPEYYGEEHLETDDFIDAEFSAMWEGR